MKIDVYTQPQCPACEHTKSFLRRVRLEYNEVDVTKDADAVALCKSLGYQELPVVVAGDLNWSGFRYEKLRELKALSRG